MAGEVVNLTSDLVAGILFKHNEIEDWSAEAKKQLEEYGVVPFSPLTSPTVKTLTISSSPVIEVSPPYYVYVANLPFNSNDVEIFYWFGGCNNIIDLHIYKHKIKNMWKLMGDCLLWLKDFGALIRVLRMSGRPDALRERNLNLYFVDSKTMKRKNFASHEIENIVEKKCSPHQAVSYRKRDHNNKYNSGIDHSKQRYDQKSNEGKQYTKPTRLLLRTGSIPIKGTLDTSKSCGIQKARLSSNSSRNSNQKRLSFDLQNSSRVLRPLSVNNNNNNNNNNSRNVSNNNNNNNNSNNGYNNLSLKPVTSHNFKNSKYQQTTFKNQNRHSGKEHYQSKSRISETTSTTANRARINEFNHVIVPPVKNIDIFGEAKPTSQNEKRMKEKFEELEREFSALNGSEKPKLLL